MSSFNAMWRRVTVDLKAKIKRHQPVDTSNEAGKDRQQAFYTLSASLKRARKGGYLTATEYELLIAALRYATGVKSDPQPVGRPSGRPAFIAQHFHDLCADGVKPNVAWHRLAEAYDLKVETVRKYIRDHPPEDGG